MASYKKPHLWNIEPFIAAGINPDTGLPFRLENTCEAGISKSDIKMQLRIIDEQTAINRFVWHNLPDGLTSDLIERILYYRGQGMFFKMGEDFYFLPYALDGGIDLYGRYKSITPLPFNGTDKNEEDQPIVKGLSYTPLYTVKLPEEFIKEDGAVDVEKLKETIDGSAVIIHDYSPAISQIVQPRSTINDSVLDIMSECLPLMRTALFNSTGVVGMRVGSQDEQQNAELANVSINKAALNGKRFVPVIGELDFQELAGNDPINAEEFLLSMQGLDNYRLSLYGLDNGGLFQKRSGMLEAEQEMNQGNVGLILQDSLKQRQDACDIINSVWGLGIWCDVSETVINLDTNGDGLAGGNEKAPAAPSNNTNEGGEEE